MPLKTYAEQIAEHSHFLASQGFDINRLEVTGDYVRCRAVGQIKGRGELSYKTTQSKLDNGCVGLVTWCRGIGGAQQTFKTYGLGPDGSESFNVQCTPSYLDSKITDHEEAAKKAYGFWINSNVTGRSDYLERKGVGAYGVRFRESEQYGRVLVIPMRDADGNLWNYQLINPDGTKRDAKSARTEGLFHFLRPLINGSPIGIAESYATAATCMENTDITCICCFGCNNIKPVICSLLSKYPDSRFIIFADNDRHLSENQGVLKAEEAQKVNPDRISLAIPDFGKVPPSKTTSDWNDLMRIKQENHDNTDIFSNLWINR